MSVKITKKENCVVELSATCEGKVFEDAKKKAFNRLASKIQIKGFRKGQAPEAMLKGRISQYEILNEAINVTLNEVYSAAVNEALKEDRRIRPYSQPRVTIDKLDANGYTATFTYTSLPQVSKLAQYKGLKMPLEVAKVGAKEVDAEINKLLEEQSTLVLKEGPAALGDTVVLDFKGYIDGKEFEGGAAQNYTLVLGSNQFIPGFEDQLVGAKDGDKVDVNVTFPTQYVKDLAGKAAKFVCMIHEVKTKEVPALDDEFVKDLELKDGDKTVETLEELKKYEKKVLAKKAETDAKNAQFNATIDAIVNGSEVALGDEVLLREANELRKDLMNQIESNGLTFEQYKQITGQTDELILEQFKNQAKENLKRTIVLNEIGQVERLTITTNDVKDFYASVAKQYSMEVDAVKAAYGNDDNAVATQLFNQKVINFIRLNNNVTEEAKEEKKEEKAPAKKAPAKKAAPKAEAPKAEEEKPAEKKAPAKKPAAKKPAAKKAEPKKEAE